MIFFKKKNFVKYRIKVRISYKKAPRKEKRFLVNIILSPFPISTFISPRFSPVDFGASNRVHVIAKRFAVLQISIKHFVLLRGCFIRFSRSGRFSFLSLFIHDSTTLCHLCVWASDCFEHQHMYTSQLSYTVVAGIFYCDSSSFCYRPPKRRNQRKLL